MKVRPGAEGVERKDHEDNSSTGDTVSKEYRTDIISDWENLVNSVYFVCANRKEAQKIFYGQVVT